MSSTAFKLADLTTVEAREMWPRVQGGIVGIGATEQHGPNLSMSVDTEIAAEMASRIAEKISPRLVLLPPVPYGVSDHHMAFTGTMTVRAETLEAIVLDLALSLAHHGKRTLVIVNGHGGNQSTLRSAAAKLRLQKIRVAIIGWFTLAADEVKKVARSDYHNHACEVETSIALELCPQLVRRDSLAKGIIKPLPFRHSAVHGPIVETNYSFDQITQNGALGDARLATLEDGQKIVGVTMTRALEFLDDFLNVDIADGKS
jgi:creatinine amidohydrolase